MFAVRNIRLCSKDCLCLYVCPTGATDTENGQVDAEKCIGCGLCAAACPSHAISMMPDKLPPQQPKAPETVRALRELALSKTRQEQAAAQLAEAAGDPVLRQLAQAVERSNRLMAEDLLREAGYMLPQGGSARRLLQSILEDEEAPAAARELLERLRFNEPA